LLPTGRLAANADSGTIVTELRQRSVIKGAWSPRAPCPTIVTPVDISNRRRYQLLRINVIESGDLHCDVFATHSFDIYPLKRPHSTMAAKQMMLDFRAELVIAQISLAGKQSKCARFDDYHPVSGFHTNRAVALVSPRTHINIRFESDRSAVTTSLVCLHACVPVTTNTYGGCFDFKAMARHPKVVIE
jgi:hypothetical protein